MRASRLALAALLAATLAAPALAHGTGLVFVSNEKSNDVWVLDPETLEPVKVINTSGRPRDMRFNSDRTRLLVACGDDDVIDVIDMASLEVVDQIPTGPSPEVFNISADDSLIYVSNEENSTVQIIDVAGKFIIHEIPTGAEPEGIAISEDGRTLYATSEVADMVHVIDEAAGAVVENIIVGTRPRRFVLTPDGAELWVSAELSGEVYVIDRATNTVKEVLSFLPPGFRQVDVTPVGMEITGDGSTVIVTLGRANHVAFVDAASKEIEDYVLVGSRAWGVGLSPDEKTLYVANGLSDDVTVIDTDTRRVVKSVPVGRVPHSVLVDD
jgi:PQQ-dependent catabolism-associated beta-propeller protein